MSSVETFYADGRDSWTADCEVRISGNTDDRGEQPHPRPPATIAVSYSDAGALVVYEGSEVAPGHFELSTRCHRRGRASLHRRGETQLEGSWVESGARGMWQIDLDDGKD